MTETLIDLPKTLSISEARRRMNELGRLGQAFFFLFDFELEKLVVLAKKEWGSTSLWWEMNGRRNFKYPNRRPLNTPISIQPQPIASNTYRTAFEIVQREINWGNSYLLNLTFPTKIAINTSLSSIFLSSRAKYKLFLPNQLVVFSPETFVKIVEGQIQSFPMKGTIDAALPNAKKIILGDKKEQAEHATIVDLIRNDLNLVASNVTVERFRYVEKIRSMQKNLLQVSSKITGQLPVDYQKKIGDILLKLLPAGSISGAPKQKTVEIIRAAEGQSRGYYTGIMGYFDGQNLDSGVLIRYIEQRGQQYFYRSGGGITTFSQWEKEYQELLDKIYVPIY
ncbi:MAG: aminodeoxychorismate synthase component I [Bacteroidota bacterium]